MQSKYGRTYGKLKSMSSVKCSDQQGRLVEKQDKTLKQQGKDVNFT